MVDRLRVIASESGRVAELAGAGPTDRPVPGCPGWDLADLVGHLGEVQRSWAEHVTAAKPDQAWEGDVPPPPPDNLSGWMAASTDALLGALRAAPDDSPCWTWWGEPRTAGAVARHQVQEAAVHRWDAESALGLPAPLQAEVAHDGVAEFLEIMIDDPAGLDGEITLRSSDTGGEWRVGPAGGRAATLRGTASDLVLLLYKRVPLSAVEVAGDAGLAQDFVVGNDTE